MIPTGFLWPPRPTEKISPSVIPAMERRGWIGQLKKNGTCSVVRVDSDGKCQFWNRHAENHRAWTPTQEAHDFFGLYPDSVFVFELLHSKVKGIRNTMYVFDVLRFCGRDLTNTTFAERQELLNELRKDAAFYEGRVIIAQVFTKNLLELFRSLENDVDEGIVLKNPKARLRSCTQPNANSGWQLKCRKPTPNFDS